MRSLFVPGAAWLAVAIWTAPLHAGGPLDPASLEDARRGLEHLYHARPIQAAAAFEQIRARLPESPAADFLHGAIEWHRVTTGPQGMTAGGDPEKAFFARMNAAIELGEKAIEKDPGDLSARFFLGGAYGYEARYLALQENWWTAYRTGKKGVGHLEKVVEADPTFGDAYLGLGIYHYYADVLPKVLKIFGTLVGLRGDREKGLDEIRRARRDGALVEEECRFFLAEIESTFEENHWRALAYSRSLRDEYPENELFTWINARILDELHLTDLSIAEWTALRGQAKGRRLTGFIEYRLARSLLFAGDFEGAAARLDELLTLGRLGSRRITMWGRLRYGVALDFLGRHEEALKQYEIAKELDASDLARERAAARIHAGRRDPAVVSLEELAETARILKETSRRTETELRRVEHLVVDPPRGRSKRVRLDSFRILEDLVEARLRDGRPADCVAAVARALELSPGPLAESRARLLAIRARAYQRTGRTEEAIADLSRAHERASGDGRRRIGRDRDLVERLADIVRPAPAAAAAFTFRARDRGELLLEVEFPDRRVPMELADGVWTVTTDGTGRDPLRYRFVADGEFRRLDPHAPRVKLIDDEAWSFVPQPKQTNSSPSR